MFQNASYRVVPISQQPPEWVTRFCDKHVPCLGRLLDLGRINTPLWIHNNDPTKCSEFEPEQIWTDWTLVVMDDYHHDEFITQYRIKTFPSGYDSDGRKYDISFKDDKAKLRVIEGPLNRKTNRYLYQMYYKFTRNGDCQQTEWLYGPHDI